MKLINESSLRAAYNEKISPFFEEVLVRGVWRNVNNVEIVYYSAFPQNPKGLIVFSTGRVESARKYMEVLYDFYQNGYAVFIHDHRGQGESNRQSDNLHHGHVVDFKDYIDDFKHILADVVTPLMNENDGATLPKHLLCHSMGCAIGALLVAQNTHLFSRVVFCSPMFGLVPPVPQWLASILLKASLWWARVQRTQASYFFGNTNYIPITFDKNRLMQSEIRYQLFIELYAQHPNLQLGGVTTQWIMAALQAISDISEQASAIDLPVLVFGASADTVVDNNAIDETVSKLPNAQYKVIEGARHELLFEQDQYRNTTMQEIDLFFTV